LLAGEYSVTITDLNGCETVSTGVVDASDMPAMIASANDTSCGETNGSVEINTTGGLAPYTYQWTNGLDTDSATDLTVGEYGITVTDDNGCQSTILISIGESVNPEVTASSVDTNCGLATGMASSQVTGGIAPYTYQWSNGSIEPSIDGLLAGTYTLIVTDATGCTASTDVAVANTSGPSGIIDGTDATCGSENGQAVVSVTGGAAPYLYEWSDNSIGQAVYGLGEGMYVVTITDANGCLNTAAVEIGISDAPISSVSESSTACGENNGAASVTVVGGQAPYTYRWSNGESTPVVNGLASGTHIVTVTDAAGCETISLASIGSSQAVFVSVEGTNIGCGTTTGSALATASSGAQGYTYQWSNGNNSAMATGLVVGVHSVTVTDASGCTSSATVEITDEPCMVDLAISKTADNGEHIVGGLIGFTVSVSNSGPNLATGVEVIDYLPAGFANPINISNGGVYDGTNIVWSDLTVPVGALINLTFEATITDIEEYTNTAEITGVDQIDVDSNPGNDNGDQSEDDESKVEIQVSSLSSIGNLVWADDDGDGIQDPGEEGREGVTVKLLDLDGNLIATTVTDAQGNYKFTDLLAGDYIIEVELPSLWQVAPMNIGNVDDLDSDINPSTRQSEPISLRIGEDIEDVDVGIYLPAVIGSTVWLDHPDGVPNVFDLKDTGLGGITINLWDMDLGMVVRTTTTDSQGQYFFEVPAGSYALEFVSAGNYSLVVPDVGGDDAFDSDPDPVSRMTPAYIVTPGMVDLTIDAGYGITVPLEWVDFWGENREVLNYLEWSVGNERNVSHYEVERAIDNGYDFEYIGEVAGKGDSYEVVTYSFNDEDLNESGSYYYRIKQVDHDGFFSYTDVIVIDVNVEKEDEVRVVIYPNPVEADGFLNINITSTKEKVVSGQIYDMKGSLISELDEGNTNVGIKNIQIDMSTYPMGAYIIRVKIGEEAFVEKVTKVN